MILFMFPCYLYSKLKLPGILRRYFLPIKSMCYLTSYIPSATDVGWGVKIFRAALLLAHRAENPAVEESARKLCADLRPRAPPMKAEISPIHSGLGGSKEQISGFESEFARKLIIVGNHLISWYYKKWFLPNCQSA